MQNTLTKIIQQQITLFLILGGLVLIISASAFHLELFKVKWDHVMAEVGGLFLIVGTLHWLFESLLKKEMLKEIAITALGSARIYESGLVDCSLNSKSISENHFWIASNELIIGVHYSSRFLENIHEVLRERCSSKKITQICFVKPDSPAADYLKDSGSGLADIKAGIDRISHLKDSCVTNPQKIEFFRHDRVLRYSFIYTEQNVWIKFFTNSKGRTEVPAFKIDRGTPLYRFFENDIKTLLKQAEIWKNN
ncbi:MAG: hypothetical protein IPN69_04435 [Acidobacteria bacterium]|nr:hypothetical protein [Acidobacteriota bacterium]